MQKVEEVFSSSLKSSLWRVHNKAMLFAVVVPVYIAMLVRVVMGHVMGIWPSVFATAFEHSALFGWSGLYMLGIIYFILPSILDRKLKREELREFYVYLSSFAFGVMLVIVAPMLGALLNYSGAYIFVIIGGILELITWISALRFLLDMSSDAKKGFLAYYRLFLVGAFLYLIALALVPLLIFTYRIFDISQLGLYWRFFMTFLPVISLAIMLIVFTTRMFPEMLGWRPIETRRFHIVMVMLLIGFLLLMISYPWYHKDLNLFVSILYGLGALGLLVSFITLLISVDFWKVRLAPTASKEHIKFIYGGMIWFLLLLINFVFYVTWEVANQSLATGGWGGALLYGALAGFIGQIIVGIYIYVINATKGSFRHKMVVMNVVFAALNVVVFLRVFIEPILVGMDWPYVVVSLRALDILLFFTLLVASLDMAYGLNGRKLFYSK